MKRLNEAELLRYIDDFGVHNFTLSSENGDITVTFDVSLVSNEKSERPLFDIRLFYLIECGDFKKKSSMKGLVKVLVKLGAFAGGTCELAKINGVYTPEEWERKLRFDGLDMQGLLREYLPVADRFSLTCPFNADYDAEHPFGCYGIDAQTADSVLDNVRRRLFEEAREYYMRTDEAERASLPDFETLFKEIEREYFNFRAANADRQAERLGRLSFEELFARGETKYVAPDSLWHAYYAVDFIGACEYSLGEMKKLPKIRPLDVELDEELYRALKPELIWIETTYRWHCTVSGALHKVFYFRLNAATARWLSQFDSDYDLRELEDLAFYRGDELLFSSCTHERFHSDCRIKKD